MLLMVVGQVLAVSVATLRAKLIIIAVVTLKNAGIIVTGPGPIVSRLLFLLQLSVFVMIPNFVFGFEEMIV